MLIKIGYDLEFELPAPTPMILLLYVHAERAADLAGPERLLTEPVVPVHDYTDVFVNRCARVVAPAGRFRVQSQQVIRDDGMPDAQPNASQAQDGQHTLQDLPAESL